MKNEKYLTAVYTYHNYVKIYSQLDKNRHHNSAKMLFSINSKQVHMHSDTVAYIDTLNRVKLEALNTNITP
jgi:hypothetical protein